MKARAPGSTSNIGPGFDVLGLALRLYVEVEMLAADSLSVRSEGEGADLPCDETHLAAAVAREVLGHDRVSIVVRSEIPVGRGLGSSAALAVAAAAAAGATDPLRTAAVFDGHAENAAASVLGGLVAATLIDGIPVARRLRLDPAHGFVVVVPDRQVLTKAARAALPETVPLADAVHNLGRLGLLVAGLADGASLTSEAADDRLHQPYRTALFPEAPELMGALRLAGATVACWSGAGPALLAICADASVASRVADAGQHALDTLGIPGHASVIAPDTTGLTVTALPE